MILASTSHCGRPSDKNNKDAFSSHILTGYFIISDISNTFLDSSSCYLLCAAQSYIFTCVLTIRTFNRTRYKLYSMYCQISEKNCICIQTASRFPWGNWDSIAWIVQHFSCALEESADCENKCHINYFHEWRPSSKAQMTLWKWFPLAFSRASSLNRNINLTLLRSTGRTSGNHKSWGKQGIF